VIVSRPILIPMFGGLAAVGSLMVALAVTTDEPPDRQVAKLAGAPVAASLTPVKTPEPRPVPVDNRLLPNLQSLPPEDVLVEVGNGGNRLRFTSIIANTGIGPIETEPDGQDECPPGERHAAQVIYHDGDGDGGFERSTDTVTSSRPAGCMIDHEGHEHWHFDAAARYWLAEPGGEPVASAEKVSFCWRDSREVPIAGSRPEEHYGDCSYETVQGITPGWADVYQEELDDQHLDLPDDLSDGTYCLWNEADPLDLLIEGDESDNAAVTAVEITGAEVAVAPEDACS
jgi:hypothetical protein